MYWHLSCSADNFSFAPLVSRSFRHDSQTLPEVRRLNTLRIVLRKLDALILLGSVALRLLLTKHRSGVYLHGRVVEYAFP